MENMDLGKNVEKSITRKKDEIYDFIVNKSYLLNDEKEKERYKKIAENILGCENNYHFLACSGGEPLYKLCNCRKEYCPICGRKNSQLHKRRAERAYDRLMWAPILGYFIPTLPKEVRNLFPDKKIQKELGAIFVEILKGYLPDNGYLSVWHLMGEKLGVIHPHLNILMPIEGDKGMIHPDILAEIKEDWRCAVNDYFSLSVPKINLRYRFYTTERQRKHKIKYVLRPIVTFEKFMSLPDDIRVKILDLKNFHNVRFFGELANHKYKKFLKGKGITIEEREIKKCPFCGTKFVYQATVSKWSLKDKDLVAKDEYTLISKTLSLKLQDLKKEFGN